MPETFQQLLVKEKKTLQEPDAFCINYVSEIINTSLIKFPKQRSNPIQYFKYFLVSTVKTKA